ncbi:MAG: hypothetical protein QNK18_06490 [Gammaproteobacteria bacterium]|nr:hypothetical protein [Gammaproteobacteria bacterium]
MSESVTTKGQAGVLVWVAGLAAVLMIASHVAGKATRDALFLTAFDVTLLPRMMLVSAILSVAAVFGMSHFMSKLGPARLVPKLYTASAALFCIQWLAMGVQPELMSIALYIQVSVLNAILISGFWSLINERFDPYTAKRTIARLAAAAAFGGLLGGLTAKLVAAAVVQPPPHGRHQLEHAGVVLDGHQLGDVDAADPTHPPEIVADEVDDHQVLGAILRRPQQLPPQPCVGLGARRARSGALDRTALDLAVGVEAQEPLGRTAENGHLGKPQIGRERRGRERAQLVVQPEGIAGKRRLEAVGEVRLVDVARLDLVQHLAHRLGVAAFVEVGVQAGRALVARETRRPRGRGPGVARPRIDRIRLEPRDQLGRCALGGRARPRRIRVEAEPHGPRAPGGVIEGEQPIHEEPHRVGQAQLVAGVEAHGLGELAELVAEIADGAPDEGQSTEGGIERGIDLGGGRPERTQDLERVASHDAAARLLVGEHGAPALELDAIPARAHHQVGIGPEEGMTTQPISGERAVEPPRTGRSPQRPPRGGRVRSGSQVDGGDGGRGRLGSARIARRPRSPPLVPMVHASEGDQPRRRAQRGAPTPGRRPPPAIEPPDDVRSA